MGKKSDVAGAGAAWRAARKPQRDLSAGKLNPSPFVDNRWTVFAIGIVLAVITLAVFGQTLRDQFINLDDDLYVYQNPVVEKGLTWQGISYVFTRQMCGFYHPLTMLSLMLDNQVYGLNPGGYHLTNVLLHMATAILLFLVLRRMMDTHAAKNTGAAATPMDALWPSAFVAAVFAIHPLRVESVAWVTERKDVLSGLFFVLTLGAYVRYTRGPFSPARYLAVIFLFALGLLSKPSLVTVPFLLLLLDYWPLARMQTTAARPIFKVWRPLIIEKIPLFVLSVAACVAAVLTQQHSLATVGDVPLLSRLGYAAVSYAVYLKQMFYPAGLVVLYPFPLKGLPLTEIVPALVLLAGISAGALALRRRHPYLLVGWLWYLGMLVPMIGLVHTGTVARADRFTYLAQIGFYLMATWLVAELSIGWRNRRLILSSFATIIMLALILLACRQTSYWKNSETLWAHTLACTSDNTVANNDLGNALVQAGQVDKAILLFQKALAIWPEDAGAYNNLGRALMQKGNVNEAITDFQMALSIRPDFAEAHNNLGSALLQKGQLDEAVLQFQKALTTRPDYAEIHNNLGNVFLRKGQLDEAILQFQKALAIQPDTAEVQNSLGDVLLQKGQLDEAILHLQKALAIQPRYAQARYNLGNVLFLQGKTDEAIVQYQEALTIRPDYAEAHYNLGKVLLQKGQLDEAILHLQKALAIQPRFLEAQSALAHIARVLATSPDPSVRNGTKAVELAEQTDRLSGGGNPVIAGTLAAAYAGAGRFPEATITAQRAVRLAKSQNDAALVAALEAQLKLYQSGSPLRDTGASR